MGFFAKVMGALNEAALNQSQVRSTQPDRGAHRVLLDDYRSRGIYVLAVHVDGMLWNYFHYPSEDHRDEAANQFWPPFFEKLGVSWHIEYID